ncbi:PIN domain-containing protein [Marinoscillum sp.]|uniref:PIN domain-containing protein n=1 Tax=Marinoscillum sp. TaxID=2024838 RepID=UPI003BAC5BB4
MKGKVFIDTSVLIYLFSTDEPEKRIHCNKLLSSLEKENVLVWSTQVAQEFYNALNRKLGVPPQKIKNYFSYFGSFELVVNNMTTINTAIDITNQQSTKLLGLPDHKCSSSGQLYYPAV